MVNAARSDVPVFHPLVYFRGRFPLTIFGKHPTQSHALNKGAVRWSPAFDTPISLVIPSSPLSTQAHFSSSSPVRMRITLLHRINEDLPVAHFSRLAPPSTIAVIAPALVSDGFTQTCSMTLGNETHLQSSHRDTAPCAPPAAHIPSPQPPSRPECPSSPGRSCTASNFCGLITASIISIAHLLW